MTSEPACESVILIGFMGAGKTSVGLALAALLGWEFEDLDERIERQEGRKVADIFQEDGEVGFRQLEYQALAGLIEQLDSGPAKIIALGGGAFVQEQIAALIDSARIPTVFLDADVEELWTRCERQAKQDGRARPLIGSRENFRALYDRRRPHYLRASFRQETNSKAIDQIAAELRAVLGLIGGREREDV
jgi:shikimate kinase